MLRREHKQLLLGEENMNKYIINYDVTVNEITKVARCELSRAEKINSCIDLQEIEDELNGRFWAGQASFLWITNIQPLPI